MSQALDAPASETREEWTVTAFRAAHGRDREAILEDIIGAHLEIARSISRRYRQRGVAEEDLEQVACVALVQVVHSYDVDRGNSFLAYAVPSIRGALKRHFRDCGWTVRPPRRVQDLQQRIRAAQDELAQRLARSPRTSEVAAHLQVTEDEVIEALAARGCFTPSSLDRPVLAIDGTTVGTTGDNVAGSSQAIEAAEARAVLRPVLAQLETRDKHIVQLRFFDGRSQQEIADTIGVTQMQVSRLIARILRHLRSQLSEPHESTGAEPVRRQDGPSSPARSCRASAADGPRAPRTSSIGSPTTRPRPGKGFSRGHINPSPG